MQSDMNIPNKFLSFEEDAFCKFYSSHANDKSPELREKISKNLSVLINNNINDLEFTDTGDIKLRERDIKLMSESGDESNRFQKNAKDIEKFIKFVGDFEGIINKEDATIIKNQLMNNVSNPFLETSVKTPLMNAWNVVQEKFIDTPQAENVTIDSDVDDLKSYLQFKTALTSYLNKTESTKVENEKLIKTQSDLKAKTNSELEKAEAITAVIVPAVGVLALAIGGPLLATFGVPLATVAIAGGVVAVIVGVAVMFAIGIVNSIYAGKLQKIDESLEPIKAVPPRLERNLKVVKEINEKISPEKFKAFCDQYENFSVEKLLENDLNSQLFFKLYFTSMRANLDNSKLSAEEVDKIITKLEKDLGLNRRII